MHTAMSVEQGLEAEGGLGAQSLVRAGGLPGSQLGSHAAHPLAVHQLRLPAPPAFMLDKENMYSVAPFPQSISTALLLHKCHRI